MPNYEQFRLNPGGNQMFDDDSIPKTTALIETAPKSGMTEDSKKVVMNLIGGRLSMWQMPQLAKHEADLDDAPTALSQRFPELFKCFPFLDVEMMRGTLPLRGEFANYQELAKAHEDSYLRTKRITTERMKIEKSSMKVNEHSGKQERITEKVDAVISGIWQLAGFSEEFNHPKNVKLLPGGRPLTLIEAFSFILAHNDHSYFSELTEDPETGEEKMLVHRGIFLPGVEIAINKSTARGEEVLKYPCYLVRATGRDKKTQRYGWRLEPIYVTMLERLIKHKPIPLITICTPVAQKS